MKKHIKFESYFEWFRRRKITNVIADDEVKEEYDEDGCRIIPIALGLSTGGPKTDTLPLPLLFIHRFNFAMTFIRHILGAYCKILKKITQKTFYCVHTLFFT